MSPLVVRSAIIALVCLLSTAAPGGEVPIADVSAGAALLSEGDRVADQGKPTEAQLRYKEGFERILPGLRRIPFKHVVKRDVTKREHLKEMLLKDFDEEMTPAEFEANEKAMKAFGLIPPDMDLKKFLVQVYSEEIAAYYDPRTKTMYMIEEPEVEEKEPPTFFERLFGKADEFDKDQNKTVIAHEMIHALADQHFDLDGLHGDAKHDDDRALAVSALIEGEATLAMIGAGMEDWDGSKTIALPAEGLDRGLRLMSPFMTMMGGGKTLREAPPVIAESMMFPYLRGMVFCASLANDGGWEAIDDAYRDPPLSTEQILHPHKFRAEPDHPTLVELGELDPGEGWRELGRNVLGEFQIGVMLGGRRGEIAAEGWDGDRYVVFEGPDEKLGLVWLSTWDGEEDAREFAKAFVGNQTSRMGEENFEPKTIPDSLWRCVDGVCRVVERRGADVAVVEGFPASASVSLLEAAFKAKKTELKPSPRTIKESLPPEYSSGQ